MTDKLDETRKSWNVATRAHNAHKRDQAAFLKNGGSTLFPDELALLGDIAGQHVLHMQCNAGQDTLSLAAHARAHMTGVDMSDEAIAFARRLSRESGIAASFQESEAIAYFESAPAAHWDVVFASYGVLPWIEDLARYLRGAARVLKDGGRFVVLEFHPLAWSFTPDWRATADPYFTGKPFVDPVIDYVAASGAALAPSGFVEAETAYVNPHKACSYQHTTAHMLQCVVDAGLRIETVREYPYANGCKMNAGLVDIGANRFAPPPGVSLPLMLGITARKR